MQLFDKNFAVSSIEFDKIYSVQDRRIALSFSDRELSFLLGYRALYVKDVENPLHTLRYTPKDSNYLLQIFNCTIRDIMAPKISDNFYQIVVRVLDRNDGTTGYKVYRQSDDEAYLELPKNPEALKSAASKHKIQDFVDELYNSSFFLEAKTALEIYQNCIDKFGSPIQVEFIINALSFHTSKRKAPKLIKDKNISSRTIYMKQV